MANRGGFGSFSHRAPVLSTDMRCYFGCNEGFKKDIDLNLHLKLRHRNESEGELRKAYQAAEEEIALVNSSASKYKCALCPKEFNNHNGFYGHIVKREHKMPWLEYKERYGSCEVESAPFECKICGRVIKYVRNSITNHLRVVHQINWPLYVERIRKMRDGQMPEELPSIELFQCKICSSSVKFMSRNTHLQGVHKITEPEYVELFKDEFSSQDSNSIPQNKSSQKEILQQPRYKPPIQNEAYDNNNNMSHLNSTDEQYARPQQMVTMQSSHETFPPKTYSQLPTQSYRNDYGTQPINNFRNHDTEMNNLDTNINKPYVQPPPTRYETNYEMQQPNQFKNVAPPFNNPQVSNERMVPRNNYPVDEAEDSLDECSDDEKDKVQPSNNQIEGGFNKNMNNPRNNAFPTNQIDEAEESLDELSDGE